MFGLVTYAMQDITNPALMCVFWAVHRVFMPDVALLAGSVRSLVPNLPENRAAQPLVVMKVLTFS